jgi:glutathionylspermidine synthase
MRFDFHLSNKGWLISEVNADVPGGFIEATAFTSLMLRHYPGHISAGDPSLALAQSVMSRIPDNGTIALVHATSFTDDRQVMEFLGRYFSVDGYKIHLVSPQHITWDHGRATLTGPWEKTPLDAVIRFFPSEWLVNLPRHDHWKGSFEHGATLQANSPWAVLTQSKRFPLVWDRLQTPLPTWQALLPRTCDVRGIVLEDKNWVVKPVLSRAGEGIVINGVTQDKESRKILKEVRRHPRHWVAQKRFDPVALVMDGVEHFPCLGVYVIDDAACGIYGRIASRPLIDHRAQDIAVLINKEADHE